MEPGEFDYQIIIRFIQLNDLMFCLYFLSR